ncbi:helix-turn-helix domain-containing protein [Mucilaginibacter aquariorum]|uniref:Helix-turn-helix transcriptional regulator n=1 Tax=Mucilaginibacter aquariorum TaxID=2967225 RepID=A0ABT1SVV1_9SPHI|nr:helix-turn-helix transcriptional regulator [Mucilaginibacter aquariorum]MCQ6956338.1 helix-turn-helix transcriptional regulator [Mucilaginibacter aquariorum]
MRSASINGTSGHNHDILIQLEAVLDEAFRDDNVSSKGLPTVVSVAAALHVSPNYFSGLLKTLTGQSTQQHIHDRLIGLAKEMLFTTGLSVSEVAYALGFDYPQSFSNLFKSRTSLSPAAFQQTFN